MAEIFKIAAENMNFSLSSDLNKIWYVGVVEEKEQNSGLEIFKMATENASSFQCCLISTKFERGVVEDVE